MKIARSCPGIQRRWHTDTLPQASFIEAWLFKLKGKDLSHYLSPLRNLIGKERQSGDRRQNHLEHRGLVQRSLGPLPDFLTQ